MNAPRSVVTIAIAAAACLLLGCRQQVESARPANTQLDDALQARLRALQLDEKALVATCTAGTRQLAQARVTGNPVDVDLSACLMALPLARDKALVDLLRRFAPYSGDEMRMQLQLELASRAGAGPDLEASAQELVQASGYVTVETDFNMLDADTFWAARGAFRRAAAQGQAASATRVLELESYEFPLAARMAFREELSAVYYRHWPEDTLANRRLLGGYAIGWRDICTQWETGVSSVQYSRGLGSLLAPVRAEVPGHLIQALPSMGRRVMDAASGSLAGGRENGAAGVLSQGLLGWNGIKRDFDMATAVASASGRDAGIAVYQAVGNCRAPRALRLLDSMLGAFEHYGTTTPSATPQAMKEKSS